MVISIMRMAVMFGRESVLRFYFFKNHRKHKAFNINMENKNRATNPYFMGLVAFVMEIAPDYDIVVKRYGEKPGRRQGICQRL